MFPALAYANGGFEHPPALAPGFRLSSRKALETGLAPRVDRSRGNWTGHSSTRRLRAVIWRRLIHGSADDHIIEPSPGPGRVPAKRSEAAACDSSATKTGARPDPTDRLVSRIDQRWPTQRARRAVSAEIAKDERHDATTRSKARSVFRCRSLARRLQLAVAIAEGARARGYRREAHARSRHVLKATDNVHGAAAELAPPSARVYRTIGRLCTSADPNSIESTPKVPPKRGPGCLPPYSRSSSESTVELAVGDCPSLQ